VYLTTTRSRKCDEEHRERMVASSNHVKALRWQWKRSCENSLKGKSVVN